MTRIVAIGGSDAGISAALRARELDPSCDFTVVVADGYPNFSICGIPYYVSGEVTHWRNLAHRTTADLEATGMRLRLDTLVAAINPGAHELTLSTADGGEETLAYDALIVGTGALPIRPPIEGLNGPGALGPGDGVHLLHSMGDTFALMQTLEQDDLERAVIVGAGYIGLEMAEGLTARGLAVTQLEQLPEVLPTVDAELGALVRAELERHGVTVCCDTRVQAITRAAAGSPSRLEVHAQGSRQEPLVFPADVVLVVVGVRPDSELAATAGAQLGIKNAIAVDRQMRTNLPDVYAAGDCVVTHHRLLGETYLPLGTTAHKQGRVAGENALGGSREYSRQPRHPGRQGLRAGRSPHRATRPRSRSRRLRADQRHEPGRRSQGLLPRQPPDHDALHGRPQHGAPARRPADRASAQRDRQTRRHAGDRDPQRDDDRGDRGARPLIHPAAWLALGGAPGRSAGLGPRDSRRRARLARPRDCGCVSRRSRGSRRGRCPPSGRPGARARA